MASILDVLAAPEACLTAEQLATALGETYRRACDQLKAAFRAGLVERAERGCYCLSEAGRAAQARGDTLMAEGPLPQGAGSHRNTARLRLWSAMRALGKFCRGDLVELAAVDGQDLAGLEENARCYIRDLSRVGYLVPLPGRQQFKAGRSIGQQRWRLVRDTGPEPPHTRRGGIVYDPNLGMAVTADTPIGAEVAS